MKRKWYFISYTVFVLLSCKVIKSRSNLNVKVRTEFPNVWGEYKINTLYIHSTTVLCDTKQCFRVNMLPNTLYFKASNKYSRGVIRANRILNQMHWC